MAIERVSASILKLLRDEYRRRGHNVQVTGFELISTEGIRAQTLNQVITLFLYRVEIDPAGRHTTIPGSTALEQKALSVELRYLLTAWFNQAPTQHQVLASCMSILGAHPILTRDRFETPVPWMADTEVKIVFDALPTEELMRIFDSLSAPYQLSVPLKVRPVLLEPMGEAALPPVATRAAAVGSMAL
jgi:hypothetical protein